MLEFCLGILGEAVIDCAIHAIAWLLAMVVQGIWWVVEHAGDAIGRILGIQTA